MHQASHQPPPLGASNLKRQKDEEKLNVTKTRFDGRLMKDRAVEKLKNTKTTIDEVKKYC